MGVIQVSLPDDLKELIDREVTEGTAASEADFLIEAARRYIEELALDNEIVAGAEAGVADAEAGRYTTIATSGDAEAWYERKMAKLRERLATAKG
jgi:predicted transcriptional regulator